MFNFSSICEKKETVYFAKAIRWIFYFLLFFTPLIYSTLTKELFEFNKMFFVYFLGTTAIFLFFVSFVIKPFKLKAPNLFILLFIGTNLVATVLSSHFYTSVWGYYSRFNGGMMSLLIFFGLYFVGIHVFEKSKVRKAGANEKFRAETLSLPTGNERLWAKARGLPTGNKKLWYVVAFSLIPIGLFAVKQHFTLDVGTRVYSTFGQPNWLAAYITMLMPLTLFVMLKQKDVVMRHVLFFALFILGYLSLWFTYSLSGMLGFILAMIAFLIINKGLIYKNSKNVGSIGFLFLICLSISFLTPGIYEQKVKDVFSDVGKVLIKDKTKQHSLNQKGFDKEKEIGNSSTQTNEELWVETRSLPAENKQISDPGFIRTHLWQGTARLVLSNLKILVIGTGPETFTYEFQNFRPKELNYSSEWNYILNKPHNYYLEILAESGVFALVSYLGIIFWSIKKKHFFITPGLIAFYTTNFFGFPVVGTSLLFWVFVLCLDSSNR